MVLGSFDTSCGSCHHHRNQIAGAGLSEPTLLVFGLPAVDLESLDDRGLWLGDAPWPADANIGDEMLLSPFMRLLLSIDPSVARDLTLLDETDDALLDLSDVDDRMIEAAGRLVWAIKLLIHDLLSDDGEVLAQRLSTAVGSGVTDAQLADLMGDFADVSFADHQTLLHNLRRLQETWIVDLPNEVTQYRANPGLLYSGRLPRAPSLQPPAIEEPVTPAPVDAADNDLLGNDDDLFSEDDDDLLGGDDDLFGEDEGDDLLGDDDEEDDLLGGEDDLLGDETSGETTDVAKDLVQQGAVDALQQLAALRLDLQKSGGWSLDEVNFAVRYRPIGHADPFLRAWLDATSSAASSPSPPATQAVFDSLRGHKTPGSCVRCHSVDAIADGQSTGFHVNWIGARPMLGERSFTTFVHRPHFNFDQFRNCTACHSIRTIGSGVLQEWKQTYFDSDIHAYIASFNSISSSQCTTCHTSSGAGDGCLTCHNYHVGSFGSTDGFSFLNYDRDPTP